MAAVCNGCVRINYELLHPGYNVSGPANSLKSGKYLIKLNHFLVLGK